MSNYIRPLVKMFGGKRYLYKWILSFFPQNYSEFTYIEPCAGACSVLLNKQKSVKEVYNDLDSGLANLVYCLKQYPTEMTDKLKQIEYSQETFDKYLLEIPKNQIEQAVRELILRRMSRVGLKQDFSWSNRERGGQPGDKNSWDTFVAVHLPLICERLKDVEVKNENALELIKEYNQLNTLVYLDPPYLKSARTSGNMYDVEMSEEEHVLLGKILLEAKSKIILSGYYTSLYAKLYKGWRMVAKEVPNHSSQAKKKERRIECLWLNY